MNCELKIKQAGIVILNWNGKSLLEQFLPALIACTDPDMADIIVADNASTDRSLEFLEEHYPAVRRIALDKNYGFAAGYNKALFPMKYEYTVLLNSDVQVTPGWLRSAVEYLDKNPEVAAIQPKILSFHNQTHFEYAGAAGGFLDVYGYPFCRGRIFNDTEPDTGQYDAPMDVFWGSGACLIIRLETFRQAGGFDPRFFAHQEEIDLCWRLKSKGERIVCLPASVVFHVGGATLKMETPRKTFLNFRNSLLMLYKNLPKKYYAKVMLCRFFLDYLAALHFLFKGLPANASAVRKARLDFHRQKKYYLPLREFDERADNCLPAGIMKKSLLKEYYIAKHKTYSSLSF
ncbi:MAG: glycosyltransferase family 2 protein [Candidatus Symbiothrix sp.]|jgi:GT2 family glycosyltransferase|nr:glycosyltransferase family 2 protein [Candidatus Symbiothrix sp.]